MGGGRNGNRADTQEALEQLDVQQLERLIEQVQAIWSVEAGHLRAHRARAARLGLAWARKSK